MNQIARLLGICSAAAYLSVISMPALCQGRQPQAVAERENPAVNPPSGSSAMTVSVQSELATDPGDVKADPEAFLKNVLDGLGIDYSAYANCPTKTVPSADYIIFHLVHWNQTSDKMASQQASDWYLYNRCDAK